MADVIAEGVLGITGCGAAGCGEIADVGGFLRGARWSVLLGVR